MHIVPSSPWIIRLSVRLYRSLIRGVGPTSYFHEYGDLTVQLFRECCDDAYSQRGFFGVLALWLPSFRDAIGQMVLEFLCERQYTSQPRVSVGTVSSLVFEWFSAPIDFIRRLTRPFRYNLWLPLKRELVRPFIHASRLKHPANMHFEHQLHYWRGPDNWRGPRGVASPYESGVTTAIFQGMPAAFLRSKARGAKVIGKYIFGSTLTQVLRANDYRGKRVRFSGEVKADHVDQQAGLVIEISFPPPQKLAERWRQRPPERRWRGQPERPTQSQPEGWRQQKVEPGTHDWMSYETTIAVPENAQYIRFGLTMRGTGQVWLANAQLEIEDDVGRQSS